MIQPQSLFDFRIQDLPCHARCFRTSWRIPSDLPYFKGHFPERPILPAIAIVDASLEFLKQATKAKSMELKSMRSGKFTSPLEPNMEVQILCHMANEGTWDIEWKLANAAETEKALVDLTLLF